MTYSCECLYIFLIHVYCISALVGCWSAVFIRIIYKFLNVCPFDNTAFAVGGKVGIPYKPV